MHKGFRTRRTYAADHRLSVPRSSATIYATATGEGILSQTCDGRTQGFSAPIIERQRQNGTPVFFVESEKFTGRYYFLFQHENGAWTFSGDEKIKAHYIAKVEAFCAEQRAVVA